MKNFKEYYEETMNEARSYEQVYFHSPYLWIANGPGSGSGPVFKTDVAKLASYSDNPEYKKEPNTAKQLLDYFKNVKPFAKKDNQRMFKIPFYHKMDKTENFDIWWEVLPEYKRSEKEYNGDKPVKPTKYIWLVIGKDSKYSYLNFFHTKNEAKGYSQI